MASANYQQQLLSSGLWSVVSQCYTHPSFLHHIFHRLHCRIDVVVGEVVYDAQGCYFATSGAMYYVKVNSIYIMACGHILFRLTLAEGDMKNGF